MTLIESENLFYAEMERFLQRKKENPFWGVNYRKPLRIKQILERLK